MFWKRKKINNTKIIVTYKKIDKYYLNVLNKNIIKTMFLKFLCSEHLFVIF